MQFGQWVWSALILGLAGTAGTASAQEAVEAKGAVAQEQTQAPSPSEEKSKDPMGWFGIGLKLGAGGVGGSDIDVKTSAGTVSGKTDSRAGFMIALPLNFGGSGFGWIIEPSLMLDSNVNAAGFYTGPTFNFHVIDPLYVGFGFGPKFAYLSGKNLDLGLDIGGRVPITGTYYVHHDIGLTAELGLGYAASGYKSKPIPLVNEKPSLSFGTAFAWDFSVGVRWP